VCFALSGDDLDFSKLLQQAETMHEPSMEDPEIECFLLSVEETWTLIGYLSQLGV
jgi:hypothetical protein